METVKKEIPPMLWDKKQCHENSYIIKRELQIQCNFLQNPNKVSLKSWGKKNTPQTHKKT